MIEINCKERLECRRRAPQYFEVKTGEGDGQQWQKQCMDRGRSKKTCISSWRASPDEAAPERGKRAKNNEGCPGEVKKKERHIVPRTREKRLPALPMASLSALKRSFYL